jgi:hypothetical protein
MQIKQRAFHVADAFVQGKVIKSGFQGMSLAEEAEL